MPPVLGHRKGCSTPITKGAFPGIPQRAYYYHSSHPLPLLFDGKAAQNADAIDLAKHSIFVSASTDPYFNLSLEDMLFRRHDYNKPLLLLYRDSPCVVIGRNQNPWKEVNLKRLQELDIPFIRRRSGGGTVYHDLGNTNYSIHVPRTSFDRNVTAQTVVRAIRRLGIDGQVNARNDICVGTNKIRSAYKIVNNRAYHHGTMLISTRLDTLGDLLRVENKEKLVTKGVASVRSPVCNLRQHSPRVRHEDFTNAVIEEFRDEYAIDTEVCIVDDSPHDDQDIKKGVQDLKTWEWSYGQTPEFTYELARTFPWGHLELEIRSKHGIVLECAANLVSPADPQTGDHLTSLASSLVGQKYGFFEFEDDDSRPGMSAVSKDVRQWLVDETT